MSIYTLKNESTTFHILNATINDVSQGKFEIMSASIEIPGRSQFINREIAKK